MFFALALSLAAAPQGPEALQLGLLSGGRVGEPLVLQLSGTAPTPGPIEALLLDAFEIPGGLPLGSLGKLYVALAPGYLFLPSSGGGQWTVQVPNLPSLAGGVLFAQALGLALPGGPADLALSNLLPIPLKSAAPAYPRFAFAAEPIDGTLSTYALEAEWGPWRHAGYAPVGDVPGAVAVAPKGSRVYTTRLLAGEVVGFRVDPASGALTPAGNAPAGSLPGSLAIDATGRFLYAGNGGSNDVSQYRLDAQSGAPVPLAPPVAARGGRVSGLAIRPDGAYLYALGGGQAAISLYRIEPSSGHLEAAQELAGPAGVSALVFSADGAWAWAAGSGGLTAYAVDAGSGVLVAGGTPPLPGGAGPTRLALDGTGRFLYAADPAGARVLGFAVESSPGQPQPLAAFETPIPGGPADLFACPTGAFLHVAVPADNLIHSFAIDPVSGALETLGAVRGRGSPSHLAGGSGPNPIAPRSTRLFAALQGPAEVRSFSIDSISGQLTAVEGGVAATAPGPIGLAAHPYLPLVTSANLNADSLTRVGYDPNSGVLAPLGSPSTGLAPFDLAHEPSGRFAYVSLFGAAQVAVLQVNGNGPWSQIQFAPAGAGSFPRGLTVDPTGRFVYLTESLTNRVRAWRIDPADGRLAPLGAASTGGGPFDVAVHPSGRFLYTANSSANTVSQFAVDPFSGTLTPLSPASVTTGSGPMAVAIDPRGRFLYTANNGGGNVSMFRIEAATGKLTSLGNQGVVSQPRGLTVDAAGRFLFVSNYGSPVLNAFRIDPVGGLLTPAGLVGSGGAEPRGLATQDRLE